MANKLRSTMRRYLNRFSRHHFCRAIEFTNIGGVWSSICLNTLPRFEVYLCLSPNSPQGKLPFVISVHYESKVLLIYNERPFEDIVRYPDNRVHLLRLGEHYFFVAVCCKGGTDYITGMIEACDFIQGTPALTPQDKRSAYRRIIRKMNLAVAPNNNIKEVGG